MSTREALIQEILKQPEPVLRKIQHYLALIVEREPSGTSGAPSNAGEVWPTGYFQKTAGSFGGELLERPPQLPFEKREEW
jgi:hypothetical protein